MRYEGRAFQARYVLEESEPRMLEENLEDCEEDEGRKGKLPG